MNDDREEAIRALFPVVRSVARRVVSVVPAADFDDLIGDGCVGLIRAVDTFDPERGTTLEMYARRLIAGAMLNGLRRLDPVSERVRRTLRSAERARFALAQELGRLPSLGELERGDEALRRARTKAYRQSALSLDAPLIGERHVPADLGADPQHHLVERVRAADMRAAIALLPERQRRIMEWYYYHELSLRAISRRLSVSPQRVSQLHLEALARLRSRVSPT